MLDPVLVEVCVRVLLADDEQLLADTVAEGLRRLAMAVDVCYDGEAAMERLGVNSYVSKPVQFEEFARVVTQLGLYWLLINKRPTES